MAIADYRLDPFLNVLDIRKITDEKHQIPNQSPFSVRLNEVPQKTDPTTVTVKFSDGTLLTEVAATPSQGQYWPDYNTSAHGVSDWNTGTILFNSADAGKVVSVTYNGLGTLVDDRLPDMAEIKVTTSTQPERSAVVTLIDGAYDSEKELNTKRKKYWVTNVRGNIKTHTGLEAGTYTLRGLLQKLVNLSHTHEYVKETWYSECNCDCSDDGGSG